MVIRPLAWVTGTGVLATLAVALGAPAIQAAAAKPTGGSTRIATKPVTPTGLGRTASAAHPAGAIAATVNGEPITETEWLDRLRLMAGKNALDNLVREKVLRQEARKNGVVAAPAEVALKAEEFEK